jgi:hypothetical protein
MPSLKIPTQLAVPTFSRPSSRGSNNSEKPRSEGSYIGMGTKHVNSAAKSEPMESPLKPIYEPSLEFSLPIEDILLKHLDGIDTI